MNTHGKIVYERVPGFAFDFKAKEGICKLIENRYCHALLALKILSTYDLEGEYLHTTLGLDIYTKKMYKMEIIFI